MEKDINKTKVIFRKFKDGGDILALFPELPGANSWLQFCYSYQHIGQHGTASVGIVSDTIPATPEEYAPLFKELESIGYNLEIVSKLSNKHARARQAAIDRIK